MKKKEQTNFKKFLFLWMGQMISSVGGGLTSFGLGVYVFQETGSAANMALVTLLGFLPTLLLSVPAGVLADRYDRRRLMMLGDGLSGIGVAFIFVCMLVSKVQFYQICIGVLISSVFSSLIDPAYRATVTDLLSKEEYAKASGMISMAGSARYLISPVLAGLLLAVSDIRLLLLIDILTFVFTVVTTASVKKGMKTNVTKKQESFRKSLLEGWQAVAEKKGVLVLIFVSSILTCFMGAFQILAEPLILDFSSSTVLGVAETVCASGMLVSGLILGIKGIRSGYVKKLSLSLLIAGGAMVFFGLRENLLLIGISGFCFFAMLPICNTSLDYLVRTNIAENMQGRAWGLIGFLSQIGYVVAYGTAGLLADGLADAFGLSVGRGAGMVILASGILLGITAILLYQIPSVKRLEGSTKSKA